MANYTGIPGFQLSNTGVGSNQPYYPAGSSVPQATVTAARQKVGNAADWIGGKLGIPETGISEKIAGGPTRNTGAVYAAETGQDLVSALISKGGYNYTDAVNAANGPNANNLRNEFLGGGSSSPSVPSAPTTYNIRGTSVTGTNNQDIANQVNPTNDYSNYATLMDPTEYYNTIDQNYNDKQALFNSNENALRAAQDAFNKTIEADYQANLGTVNTSKAKVSGQLDQNTVQAQQRKQDALNSAKQLYNQLQTGYRQRFGGASSAGEASQTILGEEQQRQSGQIGRDYQNTASQIESQRVDLENQYKDSLLQLDSQKQKALTDLQQQFVSQLAQINESRALSVEAKNTAKLQVLQNMRNQAITIQSQHEQYAQQMEALKMQQQLQIDTFNKTGGNAVNTANQAVNTFNNQTGVATSNLGQGNTTKTMSTLSSPQINNSVGYMTPGYQSLKDKYGI